MSNPIRIAINGSNGRMGRALRELLRDDPRFALVAQITASDDWKDAPVQDVVIDFSTPAGLSAALEHCERRGIALVCGTTGIDAALQSRLAAAAKKIPLLY
ncbi:MAG: 4-hydroxy-tetrahydrodipicolinate reductase, partial [Rhodanobacteraceae bacterium]